MRNQKVAATFCTVPFARALAIRSQGLSLHEPFGSGKEATLRAIEHLGYVQIDTISVIERAHHHVLRSRVPDYTPAHLHELQTKDRAIFEYWSHAAAYLPMSSYRFALPRMQRYASGKSHWFRQNKKLMKQVLDRIAAEGPLQAKDFETDVKRSGPWFDWKPSKKALEQLYMSGQLMIRERKGFQKVYDLTERVLPPGTDTRMPSPQEFARHLITSALRAHGLATEREIGYLRKGLQTAIRASLRDLQEEGLILPLKVEGIEKATYYALRSEIEKTHSTESSGRIRILSPFDNFIIQRKRVLNLFGYDYQLECYVPEPKRKFGYFTLPLLQDGKLIGRIDSKADRKAKRFTVHRLGWEPGVRDTRKLRSQLGNALEEFARFNGCQHIELPSK